ALVVAVGGDLKGAPEGLDAGVEQPLELVGDAQLQIVGGEQGLGGKTGGGEIAGARLRVGDIALDGAADASPDVELPACRGGDIELVLHPRAAGDRGAAGTGARALSGALRRSIYRERREKPGARLGDDRTRLAVGGLGGLEVLIGDVDLSLELVEHGVVI